MNTKRFILFLCLFSSAILLFECSSGNEQKEATSPAKESPEAASKPAAPAMPAPSPSHAAPEASTASGPRTASAAGVEWMIPASWTSQGERPMRLATYSIPAAQGDSEGAECAVFYFGAGQGGDVRSNIDRWIGQFEPEGAPEESSKTVNGIQVTMVRVAGTYLSPGGPMMQSQGKKTGYRLLGAIVEAPEGAVFFKTTGPAATMTAAEKDILALVDSVRKQAI